VNAQGIPLAYETFKGNLAETKTLIPVLEKLRTRFKIENITVVCDRGLASKDNVHALQKSKFHFVIATKLKSISKKLQINDLSKYNECPNQEKIAKEDRILIRTMPHPQYADTQLIITYSPSRAKKDKCDRDRLIEKLRSKIGNVANESSIKKVISNGGYKKYTTIKEGSLIEINETALKEDEQWDGFHGIAVSNSAKLVASEALSRYKELWHVEEAFRVAKCTLGTRPIFHWVPHRIKSHILLCFINLFFERFLELLLRENKWNLTPDTIRYALSMVQTTIFMEESTGRLGKMQSQLSEDAQKIYRSIDLSTDRGTSFLNECCA
jgi:transposase